MTGLELVDLRLALRRLEAAEGPLRQESMSAAGWLVRVVRVEPAEGARFEHLATVPTLAMVLSGVGTLMVEDWRVTVLAGQLVPVGVGQRVALVADSGDALIGALLMREEPAVSDGEAPEPGGEGPVDVT